MPLSIYVTVTRRLTLSEDGFPYEFKDTWKAEGFTACDKVDEGDDGCSENEWVGK